MKIYDISQEVFGCEVYPGDPAPEKKVISDMQNGDVCNLSAFSMCAHNGTHVDAPFHFYPEGKSVEKLPLEKFIGNAYVASFSGEISRKDALDIMRKASLACADKRILIKGKATVTLDAARAFAEAGVVLVGNESQTVGPENSPAEVHLYLLEKEIVLLEGVRLSEVCDGAYFLFAAPINLSGADGAPCRAVLVDFIG